MGPPPHNRPHSQAPTVVSPLIGAPASLMPALPHKLVLQRVIGVTWLGLGIIPAAHFIRRLWADSGSDWTGFPWGAVLMVALWMTVAAAGYGLILRRKWARPFSLVLLPLVAFIAAGWLFMCLLEEMDLGLLAYSSLTLALAILTWLGCACGILGKPDVPAGAP